MLFIYITIIIYFLDFRKMDYKIMQTELIKQLNMVLKKFPQYWNDEILLRPKVVEDIQNKDSVLIKSLLDNEKIRKNYATEIDHITIVDFEKLISLLKYKEYWHDSFTKYKNKIGLTSEEKYLSYNSDVVLDFPFKDCILEGGMIDENQSKNEVYYNEIIARDEIDRLLSPKIFTNTKRYSQEVTSENTIKFDEKDNLIIKGNNLIVLHSLKERYTGKVKLIYIDPPYNTGSDSFRYNDRFNHSTWLTFMKNRLEVAKSLLSSDGVIFVQCDDNEQAYLKVLMDDIFNRDNFLNTLSIFSKVSAGASGGGEDKKLKKNIEYIHIYTKDINSFDKFNSFYKRTELMEYIAKMKEENKSFKYTSVLYSLGKEEYFSTIKDGSGNDIIINKVLEYDIKSVNEIEKIEKISKKEVYQKYYSQIMTTTNAQTSIRERVWKEVGHKDEMYTATYVPKSGKNKGISTKLLFMGKQKVLVIWLKDTSDRDQSNIYKKEKLGTYWDGFSWINVTKEGKTTFQSGKKPEELIKRIINLTTKENDIVLDFHLGSGTTAAVAHKMGRRYIGIEQMDYIHDITVARLQKVIEGEQGGISKDMNWRGGGSFVYTELMELNAYFIQQIHKAQSYTELKDIFNMMCAKAYLNYQVALNKIIDESDEQGQFVDLTFDQQKEILIGILDKNQLYVNVSEIDDETFSISQNDKIFTKSFYQQD